MCCGLSLRVASTQPRVWPRRVPGCGAYGKTLLSSRDTSGDWVFAELPLSVCWRWPRPVSNRLLTKRINPENHVARVSAVGDS